MPINSQSMQNLYAQDDDKIEFWHAIPDSKSGQIVPHMMGSSGGDTQSGWKIHISIDPDQISEAVSSIVEVLNQADSPRVSIKFATKKLAKTGQPSKQVALVFYQEELEPFTEEKQNKIIQFLNEIEKLLSQKKIAKDPRAINSDPQSAETKYDAFILDINHQPTRFNYRNENCVVMEDEVYSEVGGVAGYLVQEQQILVQKSYYNRLPKEEKHNPSNSDFDPFANMRVGVAPEHQRDEVASVKKIESHSIFFKKQEVAQPQSQPLIQDVEKIALIKNLINCLSAEIESCWPYPNKDRKRMKREGLELLATKLAETIDIAAAVCEVEQAYPEMRSGRLSTRTSDLLDSLLDNKAIFRLDLK